MNWKLVLFLLISIKVHFGETKWNFISKCNFENGETHVNYECGNSDTYAGRSDLSCCTLGCYFPSDNNRRPPSVTSLKFVNCRVARLGIVIFEKYHLLELDLSNMDLEILESKDFLSATKLKILNASHNRLSEISAGLFENAPKLIRVDFSFNQIGNVDSLLESDFNEVEELNLSHNRIRAIGNRTFDKLTALLELNLEHNLIETIDTKGFSKNKNLKRILLDGNKWKEFLCSNYFVIYELNLSYGQLQKFIGKCVIIQGSLEIKVLKYENESTTIGHSAGSKQGTWVLDVDDLSEMKSLNVSNNRIDGIHGIIGRLRNPLQSLDVTGNIMNTLGAVTFEKLINLEELVLRNTRLTTIEFGLFSQQKNLRLLDISYNNLKTVQFGAFGRNLITLQSFYLDGNNLTEVDGLKRVAFPNVRVLGISDNNFTCDYLENYLEQWNGVELIEDKLTSQAYVENIACYKKFINHSRTQELTTQGSTTPESTTEELTTPELTTQESTAPELTTQESTTPELTTEESTIPELTNSESTTPESTTHKSQELTTEESTTPELTNSESTAPELTNSESTAPSSTKTGSTMPASETPASTERIDTTTSTIFQVLEKQYLSHIFILLVFISVILSLICVMHVVKYSISLWAIREHSYETKNFNTVSLRLLEEST